MKEKMKTKEQKQTQENTSKTYSDNVIWCHRKVVKRPNSLTQRYAFLPTVEQFAVSIQCHKCNFWTISSINYLSRKQM